MRVCAFFTLAALAMTACDSTSPAVGATGAPPIRIAGTWTYAATTTTDDMTASCQANLNGWQLNQSNDTFTSITVLGSQTCMNAGESMVNSIAANVTGGEIYGTMIRFVFLGCIHTGNASGDPPNHMVGISTCSLALTEGGNEVHWSGTWEANR